MVQDYSLLHKFTGLEVKGGGNFPPQRFGRTEGKALLLALPPVLGSHLRPCTKALTKYERPKMKRCPNFLGTTVQQKDIRFPKP